MGKPILQRFAGLLLGLATVSGALAQQPGGVAQPTLCQFRGASYLAGQAICLDGIRNECQADGAWIITRNIPCPGDTQPTLQTCGVAGGQGAPTGAQQCQEHRLYQCTESGSWVSVGGC